MTEYVLHVGDNDESDHRYLYLCERDDGIVSVYSSRKAGCSDPDDISCRWEVTFFPNGTKRLVSNGFFEECEE